MSRPGEELAQKNGSEEATYAESRMPAIRELLDRINPFDRENRERLIELEITRAWLEGTLVGLKAAKGVLRDKAGEK